VLFRCFREGNFSGRFFQAFAGGMNAFLVVLICFLPSFGNELFGRLTFSFQEDAGLHPNGVAYMMMLCFYLNFLSCYYVKQILKAYHILFCIISSIFIFLTLSRAVLVALSAGLAIWVCRDRKRFLATGTVIGILIIFYSRLNADFLPERITIQQMSQDNGSGRIQLWGSYIEHATQKDWLLGVGYASSPMSVLYQKPLRDRRFSGNPSVFRIYATHNMYLQIALTYGLAGVILSIFFMGYASRQLLKDFVKGGGRKNIYLSLWISILLQGMFEHVFLTRTFCVYLSLISAQISQYEEGCAQKSGKDNSMGSKMKMADFLMIFLKRRRFITALLFLCGGSAVLYSFYAPPIYKAECCILPSSQERSSTSAILSQLSGGLVLSEGLSTGELLIGVLRTRTVVDKIIDQFDLMTSHGEKYRVKMRKRVTSDILHATEDTRSGIVTVAVLDEDPERAAQVANAFVEELKNVMQSLVIGEAAQRRLFFEQQLVQVRKNLDSAEDELSKYQEKSGLVAMDPQVEAMVSSIAALRAQVAAKEVEISSLRTYARRNHPQLKRAESEFTALQGELEKLEREQKPLNGATQIASLREAPQLGMEYQRRIRDVKYATTMYEMMFKQFETAKIDESRETMIVQVLDPAVPPDYKFKPGRALIVVFATLLGLCLGMLLALLMEYIDAMKNDPDQAQAIKEIRAIFSFSGR
jgi:uncharacterized protein involved in exopolysaccharide biosynthesis